ncbi:hypothetical protein AB0952_04510 [Streptomyces caniferus]|uniref:hypothetical protein n=1 Tax=Streptomyces caniferus TaxID=285557 RepID=UPI003451CC0B
MEDPGFHHSVPSDLRDRLAEGDPRRPAAGPRAHPDPAGRLAQGPRHPAHRLHPHPVRRTGADPPGAGDRGGPRRLGGHGPPRAGGAGRAGSRRVGGALWAAGASVFPAQPSRRPARPGGRRRSRTARAPPCPLPRQRPPGAGRGAPADPDAALPGRRARQVPATHRARWPAAVAGADRVAA